VGLAIGIVQAATSINEMTLSFVPKLIFVLGGFALLSGFMLLQLSDFFAYIFDTISRSWLRWRTCWSVLIVVFPG
jgi:flagellar biosynthetic protein FliQ